MPFRVDAWKARMEDAARRAAMEQSARRFRVICRLEALRDSTDPILHYRDKAALDYAIAHLKQDEP